MKRREIMRGVRFLTFSTQRRLPLFTNPRIAAVFAQQLGQARRLLRFELYAWVVMPEHVHLMVMPPPTTTLASVLKWLKQSVATRRILRWRAMGVRASGVLRAIDDGHGSPRLWQKGGGFDRNVRDIDEFCREVRYIHRNPVERGLVERSELYQWSSVRWWMGQREGELECDPPPGDPRGWALWKGVYLVDSTCHSCH
jgi:putative transposase